MKFVTHHLTKHHLFHKPHKWFLAFLVSPIHAAEMHYKKKYHLTFRHAKKLFIFDMSLLASAVILVVATIFWYTYDPTVLNLTSVSISPSEEKIQSGDYVTYTITYANHSDVILTKGLLALSIPEGFEIDKVEPTAGYAEAKKTVSLENIAPGESGEIHISGWFYDVPDEQNNITAVFSYTQQGETQREVKARRALTTLRGSVLNTTLSVKKHILGSGTSPISITLANNGERPLFGITLPLPQDTELSIESPSVQKGTLSEHNWTIDELAPKEETILTGTLLSRIPQSKKTTPFSITPSIEINGNTIPQQTQQEHITVAHPNIILETYWKNNATTVSPGKSQTLLVNIANTGDTTLTNLSVQIPLPTNKINITAAKQQNTAKLSQETLTINSSHDARLREITPGSEITLPVSIPIRFAPNGTDIILSITPHISASVPSIPDTIYTHKGTPSPELKIGTQIIIKAEARYYTNEGDQLGRGPLPPKVGKETKYWAVIELTNTSSNLQNLVLTATLPTHVSWTGKTSVSHGADVVYNNKTRQIYWSLNTLSPHQNVGIYTELAITPTENQRGTAPVLLQNIHVTANDIFIGIPLVNTHKAINTSLPKDTTAKQKGVLVQ
jgi:hypothetical protein